MLDKPTFVSVKDYILNYGHNGEHIKLTRSRLDFHDETIINFFITRLNLYHGNSKIENININEVFELFKIYYPELSKSKIQSFIDGEL